MSSGRSETKTDKAFGFTKRDQKLNEEMAVGSIWKVRVVPAD